MSQNGSSIPARIGNLLDVSGRYVFIASMRTAIATAGAALLLVGCAGHKGAPGGADKPKASPPVVTADLRPVGAVVLVNAAAGFVVISFPSGPVPQVARRLAVYHKGLKTADIKVTGPQQDNNTVADILSGQAEPQDEVREE